MLSVSYGVDVGMIKEQDKIVEQLKARNMIAWIELMTRMIGEGAEVEDENIFSKNLAFANKFIAMALGLELDDDAYTMYRWN